MPERSVTCKQCGRAVEARASEPFATVDCPGCGACLVASDRIGQYELLEVIGQGSMGRVFRAHDHKLGRQVAIKVLRKAQDAGPKALASCLTEARALAALNHPNVVHVYAIEEKESRPFIVMELIEGDRLEQLIEEAGSLGEERALKIAIEVAKGLQAAGGVGLIHGDVKPANILLDQQGRVKLIDFGVARYTDNNPNQKPLGTPQYVAPEVVLKQEIDHRADQFCLGATLYHALSGRLPFQGSSVSEVLRARLESPPADLREVQTGLHVQTATLVTRMLQPDREQRYPTYEALLNALEDALEAARSGPAEPSVVALGQAIHQAKPTRRRKRLRSKAQRGPVLLLGLLAIVFASWVGVVFWWNSAQKRLIQGYQDLLPEKQVNVLTVADVDSEIFGGAWERQPNGVRVFAPTIASMALPVVLKGNYEVRVHFTRVEGDGPVCVLLPVGGRQVMLLFGQSEEGVSGLQWIDREPARVNKTCTEAVVIENGKQYTIDVKVLLTDQEAQIDAAFQGRWIVRWAGDISALSVRKPWWRPDIQSLSLGAAKAEIIFHSVMVNHLTPGAVKAIAK